MQSIKAYLEQYPEKVAEIFSYNPSYVFFREVEEGPLGNIEVPLTPYASVASDYRLFPKGAPIVFRTRVPTFDDQGVITGEKEMVSLARIDLFTGNGRESELVAGHLNTAGEVYFLAPRR